MVHHAVDALDNPKMTSTHKQIRRNVDCMHPKVAACLLYARSSWVVRLHA